MAGEPDEQVRHDVWGRPAPEGEAALHWPESQRVAALHGLEILDTADESDYDDITALAAQICSTPIAAISLIDTDRQWLKSRVGLTGRSTPRDVSFCTHAVAAPDRLLIVPDAFEDPRFAENPLVLGDPNIRFYAGAPLVSSYGVALGSLCVIDRQPRELDDAQLDSLATLARQVVRLIERRASGPEAPPDHTDTGGTSLTGVAGGGALGRSGRAFAALPGGVLMSAPDGAVTQTNDTFAAHLGFAVDEVVGRFSYDLTAPTDLLADQDLLRELLAGASRVVRREKGFLSADGEVRPAMVTTCIVPADAATSHEFLDQVEWLTDERDAESSGPAASRARSAASLSLDAAGRVTACNDGAARLFGFDADELLGHPLDELVPTVGEVSSPGTVVLTGRRRDGSEFPVELTRSAWSRGGHSYTTLRLRDMSGVRRTAALSGLVHQAGTLANACEQLAAAVAAVLPLVGSVAPVTESRAWLCDSDRRVSEQPAVRWRPGHSAASPAVRQSAAGAPGVSTGVPLRVNVGLERGSHDPAVTVLPGRAGAVTVQVPVTAADAVFGLVELDGPASLGSDDELHAALVLVCAELGRVGDRARTATSLTERSHTDPLTGLANRRRILELLQAEVDDPREGAAAVLFVDLDRFKAVNDTLGHAAGDEVLRTVAARFAALLRDGDTLARLGGDEFLVLCTGLPDGLLGEAVARRLLEAFHEPIRAQGSQIYLGASIGIVAVTPDATAETLLRHADIAMYRAKGAGGSAYSLFTTEMDTEVRRSLDTRNALHQALRLGELVVHYQPVCRPIDGAVVGLEALVRWDRPGFGLMSPTEFIHMAVDSGLIAAIGKHVLRTACHQMAGLRALRPDLTDAYVAVNIAADQLRAELLGEVAEALSDSGLSADRLVLEITEGALLQDLDRSSDVLGTLRRDDIRIALDDFGTGYSSLAYLSRLPVDVLKIDRSFVEGFGLSSRADALVDVVLELARALDLDVVVEGVETKAQADGFTLRGCSAVQGYYYSAAVSVEELPAVLDRLRLSPTPPRLAPASRRSGR